MNTETLNEINEGFEIYREKNKAGFRIKFLNGFIVSCVFGYGSYSDNHNNEDLINTSFVTCRNCEIGIWKTNDVREWRTKEVFKEVFNKTLYDDVEGDLTPTEILKILNWVEKQP